MKYRFQYGTQPKLTAADRSAFDRDGYRCHRLLRTKDGKPVAVLHSTMKDIWMVQNGFSSVYFGDYTEAMAYCRSRFCDLDGSAIRK